MFSDNHNVNKFQTKVKSCIEENKRSLVVKHHAANYNGEFPIWVIIEFFSMGMLSYFYKDMKTEDKKVIATQFETTPKLLESWLRCLTDLRNRCAHYSRLYYWAFPAMPAMPKNSTIVTDRKLFTQLIVLKYLYPSKQEWNSKFIFPLKAMIEQNKNIISLKHIGFPKNWEEILGVTSDTVDEEIRMQDSSIVRFLDLNEDNKREVIEIFVDGFGHMLTFAKTRDELLQLYNKSFNEELVYAYIIDEHVGGIMGLGTNVKRAIKVDRQTCEEIFGRGKGRIVYRILHKADGKPAVKNDTDLYIDFLATNVQNRKQGIATKMLEFACGLPVYKECYLDVLSKNDSAARLYQKLGFVVYKKAFNIFTFMQGLGRPILMKKRMH